ncbi:MAG TPA: aminoglycoside phosphotransferase family protein [Acidimicrobiales bacterium]|nr:aminoglycoside phosphotransferase family protein [Acidimicrobiales bacterium]
MVEEVLPGGVANAGSVVRVGDEVLRPTNPHTRSIHSFLRHLRAVGFDGVPEVIAVEDDGRERLRFIEGDVPCPPFPVWSQSEVALASTAALLARLHRASASFRAPPGATWSAEMADPDVSQGPTVVCHNDVCPENVVYRQGVAVALLDFDFAAPGRPLYDLAQLAKMCVPLDTPEDAARWGRGSLDPVPRLRIVADGYGLPPGRGAFLQVLQESIAVGGAFVARRVAEGNEAFIAMSKQMGGPARYERRREWFERNRNRFLDALG